MANASSSIFNKSARKRLRNPDDLDKCVRVTTPSVWVMLIATLCLILGFLTWGMFGVVTSDVEGIGYCTNDKMVCFVEAEKAKLISEGDTAEIEGVQSTVAYVADHPTSRSEAAADFNDNEFVDLLLGEGEWYTVYLTTNSSFKEGMAYSVSITTMRNSPISLVFG